MEYIVTRTIPTSELKDYKDYIGFLFINENGHYNICQTEEDIRNSNKWFKNLPVHTIVVSNETIEVGDTLLATAVNRDLHGKTFKFLGYTKDAVDLIDLKDKDGKLITATKFLLEGSYKFIRVANTADKIKMVNGIITNLEIK